MLSDHKYDDDDEKENNKFSTNENICCPVSFSPFLCLIFWLLFTSLSISDERMKSHEQQRRNEIFTTSDSSLQFIVVAMLS